MHAQRKELQRMQRRLGISRKDKAAKLDKKSSRGMIFENEELRLRTININAEVAEGQSNIRKLRSENDRLRREIWSLKDNYNKLEKKYRRRESSHKKYNPEHHHGSCALTYSNSEESCDSCDTCREDYELHSEPYCGCNVNDVYTDECCTPGKELCVTTCDTTTTTTASTNTTNTTNELKPHSDYTFDHLSVVSEENFSNSDGANSIIDPITCNQGQPSQPMSLLIHPLSVASMSNDHSPLTPLTPVELIASQLNDLQNAVPPLSYFENIANEKMNENPVPTTSNGWDFSCTSPFHIVTLSPSHTNVPAIISPVMSPVFQRKIQSSTPPPPIQPKPQNSPKNFFSTIKPRPLPVTSPPPLSVYTSPPPPESIIATPTQSVEYIEPIYAQVKKVGRKSQENMISSSNNSDSNGINLRGILDDIENLSQDIMNMQFNRKPSIEAKSLENVTSSSDFPDTEKPYKSEINLMIMNPGEESPPPNVPEPMQPIYPFQYGFERFDIPVQTIPFVLAQPPQIPQLPLQIPVTSQEQVILPNVYTLQTATPVIPIVPTVQELPTVPAVTETPTAPPVTAASSTSPPINDQPPIMRLRSLSAEAKRKLFKNRSNESTSEQSKVEEEPTNERKRCSSGNGESSSGSEMTNSPSSTKTAIIRRPSFRHVSIADDNSSNPNTPTGQQPPINTSQQSISNSPHSSQRRNSITPGTPSSQAHSNSNNSNHGHHHRHNHHLHHHHSHNQHPRKMSQDSKCSNILGGSLSGGLLEGCSKTLKPQQSHGSRRHSDGTVTLHGKKDGHTYSIASDRNSFAICSNVGSGSSTSSLSSLKSNRSNFSGVSYSTRSNRRKLSVNSTAQAPKIPWCGCWGNGCL